MNKQEKGKNRKVGRNKNRPSGANQKNRTTANKARNKSYVFAEKILKVGHGSARAARRKGLAKQFWARAFTRIDDNGNRVVVLPA